MSKNLRSTSLLIAALGIAPALVAMAGSPAGTGDGTDSHGPGSQGGYPQPTWSQVGSPAGTGYGTGSHGPGSQGSYPQPTWSQVGNPAGTGDGAGSHGPGSQGGYRQPTWPQVGSPAGTGYGAGPYGPPGYQGGYPQPTWSQSPSGTGVDGTDPAPAGQAPAIDRTSGYGGRSFPGYGFPRYGFPRYGSEVPQPPYGSAYSRTPYGDTPAATLPSTPGHPDYGPRSQTPRGSSGEHPGPRSGRAGPGGLQISRATAEDAYILTIALDGMAPETVQVRTQGPWLLVNRTHSAQQERNDRFATGRGFTRSFSYSSGTTSRRLAVPPDAVLSAMSREEGEDSIRIRIPRRGHRGSDQGAGGE